MTEEINELAKKAETALAAPAPRKMGLEEDVDKSDLIVPRLMLIQYTPPKTVAIDEKLCPPGTLINSLTTQPVQLDDKGGVPIIPIIRGVKWILFNAQDKDKPNFDPQYEPGAKIWESRDPEDPRVREFGDWGPNNEPPRATKFIEFLIMIPSESMPLVIGFAKTSFNAGKQLSSMVQYTKKPAIFHDKYRLSSKKVQNDQKQSFYVLTVQRIGDATEAEIADAKAYYDTFVGRKIKAHGDEEEEAVPVAPRQPWE
jgi:hypothetical protein